MTTKLLLPHALRVLLARRFENQRQNWLVGGGTWPLTFSIGLPTEKDATEDLATVRQWVTAWQSFGGPGEVIWEERRWARLGVQRLPSKVAFTSAADVAKIVGQGSQWILATQRYSKLSARWAAFGQSTISASKFGVLTDYLPEDFDRLWRLLEWLEGNPNSQLYMRQLPVEGLDTKWLEQRLGVVGNFVRSIRGEQGELDFYDLCGLRKIPHRARIRVLCPDLRRTVGGLCDIEVPLAELSLLNLTPSVAIVVENVNTGIALPEIPGAVAFMGLGNAVGVLACLPWLQDIDALYWGDIDTYGFLILEQAKRALPRLRSVLMDEETLLTHRSLWGKEPVQCPDAALDRLNDREHSLYTALRASDWGENLRLEQERLPWHTAISALKDALPNVCEERQAL